MFFRVCFSPRCPSGSLVYVDSLARCSLFCLPLFSPGKGHFIVPAQASAGPQVAGSQWVDKSHSGELAPALMVFFGLSSDMWQGQDQAKDLRHSHPVLWPLVPVKAAVVCVGTHACVFSGHGVMWLRLP